MISFFLFLIEKLGAMKVQPTDTVVMNEPGEKVLRLLPDLLLITEQLLITPLVPVHEADMITMMNSPLCKCMNRLLFQ